MSSDVEQDYDDYEPDPLDCCKHCEHSVNDPPHDRACEYGCNQDVELRLGGPNPGLYIDGERVP